MKMEKVLVIGLWLVVAYAVALLTYSTFDVFLKKGDADISAFGSILSAIAGFAACLVAAYLYSSWQEQKSYDLKKEYFQKISLALFGMHQRLTRDSGFYSNFENCFYNGHEILILNFPQMDYNVVIENEIELLYLFEFVSEFENIDSIRTDFERYRSLSTHLSNVNSKIDNIYHLAFNYIYKDRPLSSALIVKPGQGRWTSQLHDAAYKIHELIQVKFPVEHGKPDITYEEMLLELDEIYKRTTPKIAKLINPYSHKKKP